MVGRSIYISQVYYAAIVNGNQVLNRACIPWYDLGKRRIRSFAALCGEKVPNLHFITHATYLTVHRSFIFWIYRPLYVIVMTCSTGPARSWIPRISSAVNIYTLHAALSPGWMPRSGMGVLQSLETMWGHGKRADTRRRCSFRKRVIGSKVTNSQDIPSKPMRLLFSPWRFLCFTWSVYSSFMTLAWNYWWMLWYLSVVFDFGQQWDSRGKNYLQLNLSTVSTYADFLFICYSDVSFHEEL